MKPSKRTKPRRRSALIASARSVMEVLGALMKNHMVIAVPLLLVLLVLAGLLAVLALVPAISPFVYPLL